ncbi:MAG TPA: lipoyl domain-containing protein [Pirellulales bacterium]|jgi:2-oxoglutarate dehydrogenase E2 component (dihydrolipoamide succinyltransferase)|nr:lipoyl domain-containing protein [Pirellulales bacterium]
MRITLLLPELGLDDAPIVLSLWLVPLGSEVAEGDRLVEVLADGVTVDLPSPASGVLVEMAAGEDDSIRVGQLLGVIEAPGDDAV